MTGSIVVVCHANVCRSVVGEVTLAYELHDVRDLTIRSGGVAAEAAAPGCRAAADLVQPTTRADVLAHRAAPVENVLTGATLVLTAEREQRGSVLRRQASLRRATFTLPEAVDLALAVAQSMPSSHAGRPLAQLVEEMDARRGLVRPRPREAWVAPAKRWRRQQILQVHPWDLPDAHLGQVAHDQLVPRVAEEARNLAAVLRRWSWAVSRLD